jgi:hypothetical protein
MMKVLPRYRFHESGVGCAEHSDPTCLCDVVVVKPVQILNRASHRFWGRALDELGDDVVSDRNLHEAASIVLGLHKLERALQRASDQPMSKPVWQALPAAVVEALRNHARVDSPKHIALMELDGLGLDAETQRQVSAAYVNLAAVQRAHDRRRGDRIPEYVTKYELLLKKSESQQRKRAKRTPEQREALLARRKRWRESKRKPGKSWLEAKRTGGSFVPGTYELGAEGM